MSEKDLEMPVLLDHQRVWRTYTGGDRLNRLLGQSCGDHYPEEWILSVTEARNAGREQPGEGLSMVKDRPGLSLRELIESDPEAYLGIRKPSGEGGKLPEGGAAPGVSKMPGGGTGVLVKLIDARERLTVQVHPDREKAQSLFHSPYGKTECWYILGDGAEGEEPPCVYLGFQEGITKERWMELFARQDIEGMLGMMHRFEVKKGDMILVQGGVPHAIGAGCFLAEIQEPTDFTIRIERVTPAGFAVSDELCHQGLGFEKMFDCFSYEGLTREEARRRWFVPARQMDENRRLLIGKPETSLFSLYEIQTKAPYELDCGSWFCGLYLLNGEGTLQWDGGSIPVKAPEQIFVPAACSRLTILPGTGTCGSPDAGKEPFMQLLQFFGPQDAAGSDAVF